VGRRGRNSPATPVTLPASGLLAKFDPANVSATGGNVDSWSQSGGSVSCTVTSSGGLRPTQVTVSGNPWIAFAGASSQKLSETSSALALALSGVAPYTVYAAVQRNDPSGGLNGTFFGWSAAAGSSYVLHTTQGPNKDQYSRSAAGAATNNITAGSPWTTAYGVYASVFTGSSVSTYFDGTLLQSASNSRNAGTGNEFALGCYVLSAGSFGGYLDGRMGIILFYSGAHSAYQVQSVTRWFRLRYGF